jgi:thermitase
VIRPFVFHVKPPFLRNLGRILPSWLVVTLLVLQWPDPTPAHGTPPVPATVSARASGASGGLVRGVVLVRRRPGVSLATLTSVLGEVPDLTPIPGLAVEKLRVGPGQEQATANRLRASALVEFAEPDYVRQTMVVPNDPLYSQQWALPKIDAPGAWQTTFGTSNVVVAVIDTGFDLTHPDRPIHLSPGPTYSSLASLDGCPPEGVSGPRDDFGHGTHVGGIIAAATNNGVGIAGLAPNVTVLVIKAADCVGNLADSDVASALAYAVSAHARVINMSFGGTAYGNALDQAVQGAWNSGAVLVAAAGNDGRSEQFYPADLPHVVAVAATDPSDALAPFSNYGPSITVAAPGVAILGTVPNGAPITGYADTYYALLSGTSMATPHVAGIAALVLSAACRATNSQVIGAIERGAVQPGSSTPNPYYGYGRVDAAGALRAISGVTGMVAGPLQSELPRRLFLPVVATRAC